MNEKIAKALCDAKIMKFGLFSLASGRKSPVYVDVRVLPSSPGPFAIAIEELSKKVKELKVDAVAGAETAGIPIAAAIGLKAKIPMLYVRKRPKSYGTQSFIEGILEKGQKVVLIDDMITDGKSKLRFIDGIKEEGADCRLVASRDLFHSRTKDVYYPPFHRTRVILCGSFVDWAHSI